MTSPEKKLCKIVPYIYIYNCAKFSACGIFVTKVIEGGGTLCPPRSPETAPKTPRPNMVKVYISVFQHDELELKLYSYSTQNKCTRTRFILALKMPTHTLECKNKKP